MIDPATGWVEICTVPSVRQDLVSHIVELVWLTRYSLSSKAIVDRGNEFWAKFKIMFQTNFGITLTPIIWRNSQANAILERVYQTIVNIIRTFKVQDMVLDDENPWDGILVSTIFTLRAALRTTTKYTPEQLACRRDTVLNTHHKANYQSLRNENRTYLIWKSAGKWRSKRTHV